MDKRSISKLGPELSRLITGVWRWENLSDREAEEMIKTSLEVGMTTFDHADIYGDHTIEEKFGKILHRQPSLRNAIQLISKCGIKFPSTRRPENKSHIYDTSKKHIIWSAENSLQLLSTDHLDLLLIHRPDPLSDPFEIAEAFEQLRQQGKVLHFGVSNFSGTQFRMLQKFLSFPLVTNQIELSIANFDPFFNGDVDTLIEFGVNPMAWSPFAGGNLFDLTEKFSTIANRNQMTFSQLALGWLLAHPSCIFPIIGTTRVNRLKEAAKVLEMHKLDRDTWFEILKLSRGFDIP